MPGLLPRKQKLTRKSKRLLTTVSFAICLLIIWLGLIPNVSFRYSSPSKTRSKSPNKIRFVDTLSSEELANVMKPGNSMKTDNFFQIDENPNQVNIDLKLLSSLNLKTYKRELREFQTRYNYLKYDDASIKKFFNQQSKNYFSIDSSRLHHVSLYTKIFETILDHKPTAKPLKEYQTKLSKVKDYAMQLYYERFATEPTLDEAYLGSHGLLVGDREKKNLKEMHSSFLKSLKELSLDLKYGQESTNGIVYVGGGKFTFLALLSIISLRETGSNLPVEVLIPNQMEHEPEFCDIHLKKLNAKCILLPKYLSPELTKKIDIAGYQYKSIALLMSSFENVLLLDSDSFVLRSPDEIFETQPFSSTGMVVWPDYWRRVTHPAYYEIASLPLKDIRARYGIDKYTFKLQQLVKGWFSDSLKTSVPLHDRENAIPDPSSETGQLLINKRTHLDTILLSLYYNYYGPDYYYPLFSQGTQGEGDKETFIAAAHALHQSYYQINKRVEACGYWEDGEFTGTGMFQFDPITDYLNLNRYLESIAAGSKDAKYEPDRFPNSFTKDNSKMLFLHNNYPKIDPYRLIKDGNLIEKNKENKIVKMIRLFGPVDNKYLGKDLELLIWEYVSFYLCDMKVYLRSWDIELYNADMNRNDVCQFVSRHLGFLSKYDRNAVFT